MRKKSKLPDNLYHFTSLIKYRIILESGKLALTPSVSASRNSVLVKPGLQVRE